MKFDIENIEDILKEIFAEILPSSTSVEINEIYNRDIDKLWLFILDWIDAKELDDHQKEMAVLEMPRYSLNNCIRKFYGI